MYVLECVYVCVFLCFYLCARACAMCACVSVFLCVFVCVCVYVNACECTYAQCVMRARSERRHLILDNCDTGDRTCVCVYVCVCVSLYTPLVPVILEMVRGCRRISMKMGR
jgi:NADH:ubiquinone oxidoreductase subunit 6 (subunit J)